MEESSSDSRSTEELLDPLKAKQLLSLDVWNALEGLPSPPVDPFASSSMLPQDEEAFVPVCAPPVRHRAQKTRVPLDQQDDKYLERRRKNNALAKEARDRKKLAEKTLLQRYQRASKENALLRERLMILQDNLSILQDIL